MYVSARLEYALRALVALAGHAEVGSLPAARLAEQQGVSETYVGAILNELRRAGLVVNERGRNGGYRLAQPADQISIADVVAALRIWPVDVHGSGKTSDEIGERLGTVWQRLGGATVGVLASVSVADVARGTTTTTAAS